MRLQHMHGRALQHARSCRGSRHTSRMSLAVASMGPPSALAMLKQSAPCSIGQWTFADWQLEIQALLLNVAQSVMCSVDTSFWGWNIPILNSAATMAAARQTCKERSCALKLAGAGLVSGPARTEHRLALGRAGVVHKLVKRSCSAIGRHDNARD